MLTLKNVQVVYDRVLLVLRGISLEVPNQSIVALLGANGAGKTTALKAISGLLRTELGEVVEGSIEFEGVRIDTRWPEEVVRMGVVQVQEGRRVCEHLTVEQNLRLGASARSAGADIRGELDRVYSYFPRLRDLRKAIGGYLSGGEQQMLVIGRALMARPKLLLLDEPSLGLSPLLVQELFRIVKEINEGEKTAILLVEQNAMAALNIAQYGYVLENGRVVLEGTAADLKENADIKEFYLGLSRLGSRRSYREAKAYRRRKRWLG